MEIYSDLKVIGVAIRNILEKRKENDSGEEERILDIAENNVMFELSCWFYHGESQATSY